MPQQNSTKQLSQSTKIKHDNIFSLLVHLLSCVPRLSERGLFLVLVWVFAILVLSLLRLLAQFYDWQMLIAIANMVSWVITIVVFAVLFWSLLTLLRLSFFSPFLSNLYIERQVNTNLSVYNQSLVSLSITSDVPLPSWALLWLIDLAPENSDMAGLPICLSAKDFLSVPDGGVGVRVDYELTPNRRGTGDFAGVGLCLVSRFGLWQSYHHMKSAGVSKIRVFADFQSILSGNLLVVAQKSAVHGMIKRRRRGQGQDFHQIRSYSERDSIRHVDWRATSRLNRLMSREYQDEQEQEILFLLDTSQQMRHQRLMTINEKTYWVGHLDMVLNAMLLLANIASNQGDATGFISFSGVNDKVAPPKKGVNVMNYLLNQSFDIDTSLKMPDYIVAARMALSVLKKRSLVVLMTSTRSEGMDELLTAVGLLQSKHLVIVANLYEQDLADKLTQPIHTLEQACTYHSIREHLNHQIKLNVRLSAMPHVYPIHCTPSQLPQRLVQSYLSIKQRQT